MTRGTGVSLPRRLHAGMLAAALLTPFASTTIAVALPDIGRDLGVEASRLNLWLVACYLLVSIAGQGPGGRLGDRLGHERALRLGLALHASGSILGALAPGLAVLAAGRLLGAAGGVVTLPAVMALLRNRTEAGERSRAFGTLGGALGLAATLGPPAGGALVAWLGWRAIFAVNLPAIAAALLLTARRPPQELRAEGATLPRPRPDLAGSILLVLGLAPLVLALDPSWNPGPAAGVAGVAILALFAAWETRAPHPVFDLGLFAARDFAAGSAIVALHNLAMYGLLFLIPAALPGRGAAELLVFGMLAGMLAGSPLGGRLAGRLGARATAAGGAVLALGGIVPILAPGALADPLRALPALIALGAGMGLAQAPAQAAALTSATAGQAGSAAGALSTMRYLGGLAGIALVGEVSAPALPAAAYASALAAAAILALRLPGRTAGMPDAPSSRLEPASSHVAPSHLPANGGSGLSAMRIGPARQRPLGGIPGG